MNDGYNYYVENNKLDQKINNFYTYQGFTFDSTSIKPDTLLSLVYTSGTTGRPKGVRVTQGNVIHTGYVMVN